MNDGKWWLRIRIAASVATIATVLWLMYLVGTR
jgi:hypothetical protein